MESVKISVKILVDAIKELESWSYWNEELGVWVTFKIFFTMVDSGLVNKATDNRGQNILVSDSSHIDLSDTF